MNRENAEKQGLVRVGHVWNGNGLLRVNLETLTVIGLIALFYLRGYEPSHRMRDDLIL
jgi:hypothetical protein